MIWLLAGVLVLLGLMVLGKGFVRSDPRKLAATVTRVGGVSLLGVAIVLAALGRWGAALPVGLFGLSLLGYSGFGSFGGLATGRLGGGGGRRSQRSGQASSPRVSRAKSALVELELDHADGSVQGRVLSGPQRGRALASLSLADVVALWAGAAADRESRALLEVYLDRREPRWREHLDRGAAGGQRAAPRPAGMSEQEAYETLGLAQGAGPDEVRTAHRNLMKRVHPDMGGSAALAARINEAKERLLRGHDRGP